MNTSFLWLFLWSFFTGAASAQVFLNEILDNPPGASFAENQWEYIELYGRAGMSLDGYVLLVLKGGVDDDRNGVPELMPQVDEVFLLDGLRLSGDGMLLLVNSDPNTGRSVLSAIASGETDYTGREGLHARASATFQQIGVDRTRTAPRLDHDGSSTYMLVRQVVPTVLAEVLVPGHEHDVDFDGRFDVFTPELTDAERVRRFQIVDVVSWSNRGGKEYGWLSGYELSETHGINPDGLSRVAFYVDPPSVGSRTKDRRDHAGRVVGFEVLPTSIADESFVYGVLDSAAFPRSLAYYTGSDLDGWPQIKSPTDVGALPYEIDRVDPEPDTDPFPRHVRQSVSGEVLLADRDVAGFGLTPGVLNDLPGRGQYQQRLVLGDLDFDGDVDENDAAIAEALLGASPDDVLESSTFIDAKWQGGSLQRVLALVELHDDEEGEDAIVSEEDVRQVRALVRAALGN